jgi:hypothetical protein
MAILVGVLTGLGRYEAAAVIAGFADTPLTRAAFPELNTDISGLRQTLGDDAYEMKSGDGAAMTTAAVGSFALDQIDQARAQLGVAP